MSLLSLQKLTRKLRNTYHSKMQTFLHHNNGYTKNFFTYIDWNMVESPTKLPTLYPRIWLTKFVSEFCVKASKICARKTWDSPMCPICSLIPKNTNISFHAHIVVLRENIKIFLKTLSNCLIESTPIQISF